MTGILVVRKNILHCEACYSSFLSVCFQVAQDEIDKYTQHKMPTKNELHAHMDQFSFMPRISFAEEDSIKVCHINVDPKFLPGWNVFAVL